jgi:hypothetical protein
MKATLDIPDELYRRVKAKSALQGRAIREVTIDLYRHWLEDESAPTQAESAEEWLDAWIRLGEETLSGSPPGPTATETLDADRGRLEPVEPC